MKKEIFFTITLVILLSLFAFSSENDTAKYYFKEVVISALRYPEKILEVPLSVSYLDSKNFYGYRGISIEEPLQTIPGVLAQIRSGTQDVRITARGFGSRGAGDRSNSGTVRGIKFLLDGIPQTEPDGRTSLDFFDIAFVENLEVIRSNASALWGNSAGAVFSFNTIPSDNKPSASFSKSIGSWNFDKNVLKLKTSIGENGVIYLNSLYFSFDGWRKNSYSDKLLFNFGIRTPLGNNKELSTFDDKKFAPTILQVNLNIAKNLFYIPGAITKPVYDSLPESANPNYLNNKERRNNRLAQIGVSITHNFSENNMIFAQGFLTSKYLQRSERGTYRDFTRYFLGSTLYYQNQMKFGGISNIFLLGLDQTLQDGAILFYNLDSNANRSNQLRTDKKEGSNTFGLFLQDEILWKRLSILLGLRYDAVTYVSQDFLNFTKSDEKKFDRLTPKVGITYRLLDNFSIFGNIGGGIEVPAGNETDPAPGEDTVYQINPLLEPIVSTTYELGIKSFFETGKYLKNIEFEASGFYIDTKNELIPYREGRFYFSAGKTSRLGLEALLKTSWFYGISINASFTYILGKFVDYKVDSSYYNPDKKGVFADFKNNFIPGVPKFYYFASIVVPFIANFEFSVNGLGKYYCDDANKIEVPAFNVFNFSVWFDKIYINNQLNIWLAFSVKNVFNTKYIGSAFLNPIYEKGTSQPYYIEPGLPRNYLFTIGFKF
ncbi:MAG: TonB-dependent receptor domain-containing protein [Candidatus Kapaibacteriota bacterium]